MALLQASHDSAKPSQVCSVCSACSPPHGVPCWLNQSLQESHCKKLRKFARLHVDQLRFSAGKCSSGDADPPPRPSRILEGLRGPLHLFPPIRFQDFIVQVFT